MRLLPSFRFDANWTPRTEGYALRCHLLALSSSGHQGRGPLSMVHFLVGLNLSTALLAVLSRVPCPLDLRRPLLPQPQPCCVCIWGLHRSCSSRPPVKTCLIGSLLWRWYPRVQHVVSTLFSQPICLSSVLVHAEGPSSSKTKPKGFVTGEAFMTMPLTVPSLMYRGNRRSPKLGLGSPVAD